MIFILAILIKLLHSFILLMLHVYACLLQIFFNKTHTFFISRPLRLAGVPVVHNKIIIHAKQIYLHIPGYHLLDTSGKQVSGNSHGGENRWGNILDHLMFPIPNVSHSHTVVKKHLVMSVRTMGMSPRYFPP